MYCGIKCVWMVCVYIPCTYDCACALTLIIKLRTLEKTVFSRDSAEHVTDEPFLGSSVTLHTGPTWERSKEGEDEECMTASAWPVNIYRPECKLNNSATNACMAPYTGSINLDCSHAHAFFSTVHSYLFHHKNGWVVIGIWIEGSCCKCSGPLLQFNHPHISLLPLSCCGAFQQCLTDGSRVHNSLSAGQRTCPVYLYVCTRM